MLECHLWNSDTLLNYLSSPLSNTPPKSNTFVRASTGGRGDTDCRGADTHTFFQRLQGMGSCKDGHRQLPTELVQPSTLNLLCGHFGHVVVETSSFNIPLSRTLGVGLRLALPLSFASEESKQAMHDGPLPNGINTQQKVLWVFYYRLLWRGLLTRQK